MLPALLTSAYLLAAYALCIVALRGATGSGAVSARWERPRLAQLAYALTVGVLVFVSDRLLPGAGVWFGPGVCVVVTGKLAMHVLRWRRFFAGLDEACTGAETASAESPLRLREPPAAPRAYLEWATRIMVATARAHDLGRSDRNLSWLDAIDLRRVPRDRTILIAQHRATFALAVGRVDLAREAVARVPAPAIGPELEDAFALLRALLGAIDGDAAEPTLIAARAARMGASGRVAHGWMTVEAHVLAARGDELGALALLRTLEEQAGPYVVERVGRHRGPASALARRLCSAAPYR